MIVGVKYKNERTGKYGGRAYSYNCELEDPKDGDVVVAPVKDGECEAVIVELDVDPATTEGIQLKTITKRAENAADKATFGTEAFLFRFVNGFHDSGHFFMCEHIGSVHA